MSRNFRAADHTSLATHVGDAIRDFREASKEGKDLGPCILVLRCLLEGDLAPSELDALAEVESLRQAKEISEQTQRYLEFKILVGASKRGLIHRVVLAPEDGSDLFTGAGD